jgi:hypothetical protein
MRTELANLRVAAIHSELALSGDRVADVRGVRPGGGHERPGKRRALT